MRLLGVASLIAVSGLAQLFVTIAELAAYPDTDAYVVYDPNWLPAFLAPEIGYCAGLVVLVVLTLSSRRRDRTGEWSYYLGWPLIGAWIGILAFVVMVGATHGTALDGVYWLRR